MRDTIKLENRKIGINKIAISQEEIGLIDENFLARPKRDLLAEVPGGSLNLFLKQFADWRSKVLDTLDAGVREVHRLEYIQEVIPTGPILVIAMAYRRIRLNFHGMKIIPIELKMEAKRIIDNYHMKDIALGGPAKFKKQLNRVLKNIGLNRCKRCGYEIWSEKSLKVGLGSHCRRKVRKDGD